MNVRFNFLSLILQDSGFFQCLPVNFGALLLRVDLSHMPNVLYRCVSRRLVHLEQFRFQSCDFELHSMGGVPLYTFGWVKK